MEHSSNLPGRSTGRVNLSRSTSTSSRVASPSQIKVVARFRPVLDDCASCVENLTANSVQITGLKQQFNFDHVFGPESNQKRVFDGAVRPIVEGVLAGYNGCVLAYGQTGAGKSHTMTGNSSGEGRGAIPRMIEYLFDEKHQSHKVKVGYLEIYNEKVRDLLNPSYPADDLRVHEVSGGGGFYVKGLTEVSVDSADQVYAIMRRGSRNRSTAATNMNANSSRSHSVFLVDVYGSNTRSKLVLVDLAGSEKVAKSGATGALLEEAANINRSLSSLGMVVNALSSSSISNSSSSSSDNAQQPSQDVPPQFQQHIPFRDSKLTRILQDSLAGNSRTCLIIHCSPSIQHISETVSTLRFGIRAKYVKTVPRINHILNNKDESAAAYIATINELQNAHSDLQKRLLETYRESNKLLSDERARLVRQRTLDLSLAAQKKQQIEMLESQLEEEERRANSDECYLFTEISRLEPRIANQSIN